MRNRRRFSPYLEQLEARVVLSRISLLPVETTGDSSNETDSEEAIQSEPIQNTGAEDPGRQAIAPRQNDSPISSPTRVNETNDSSVQTEPTREESPTTTESDPTTDPAPTKPRSNEPRATLSEPDVSDSPTVSSISRTVVTEESPAEGSRDTDFEPQPLGDSRLTLTGETTVRVLSDPEPTRADSPETDASDLADNSKDAADDSHSGDTLIDENEETADNPQPIEPIRAADAEDPASEPTQTGKAVDAIDLVFWNYQSAKVTLAESSSSHHVPVAPVQRDPFASFVVTEVPLDLAGDHVGAGKPMARPTTVMTPEALTLGVLALNGPYWIRRLTAAWGSEEFHPQETEAMLARRRTPAQRRQRTRKIKASPRSSTPRDRVFAEHCLMSLLEFETEPDQESSENSLAGRAWFWVKVTAIASAATAVAKRILQRFACRPMPRLKPATPRYTGPTLWQ